ncbi:hypothetical protein XENOCAPTIV_009808 [Xenoophorus captivus]|uniref:Uncharacterized protein n=1 Tax=Xenoophorus captivus TaxID=1517983 RepID=A0ABV0RGK1_9TELE
MTPRLAYVTSSSESFDWIEVPTLDPSSPEAQRTVPAPSKAFCSCTCAVTDNRYGYVVVPDDPNEPPNFKIKLRPVPTAETPSFSSCACYHNDMNCIWTKAPVPDPNGCESLKFAFQRAPASNSSTPPFCHCFIKNKHATVTEVKNSKRSKESEICCSCLCSYCCLCCYTGTQYGNPVSPTQKSNLTVNYSKNACCSTSSDFHSFSRQKTAGFAEKAKIARQLSSVFSQTKPVPLSKKQELQFHPKENSSLSRSRQKKSRLPAKKRIGSQLAPYLHPISMPPTKTPQISINSNENSTFGADNVPQSLSKQKTASFSEKTKTASQVGAAFFQTKPMPSPKHQELPFLHKEKSSLSISNGNESSSRQQTSSLPVKPMKVTEFPSHSHPEPKRPRISINSNENSTFRADIVPQSLSKQKTASFSEKTKTASQVGAAFFQTKPMPSPKQQELPFIRKEKSFFSISNGDESSSRQQTSSLPVKRIKVTEFPSHSYPEAKPSTKRPRISINPNENSLFGADNVPQSLSKHRTASFSEKTKTATQVGAACARTKPIPPPKHQELTVIPKEKSSLSASDSAKSSSRPQTSGLPEKQWIANQPSTCSHTEPNPPTEHSRCQHISSNNQSSKESNTSKSSSRKQTSSFPVQSTPANIFGSTCPTEPIPIKRRPMLHFNPKEKWVKNLKKILNEQKHSNRR